MEMDRLTIRSQEVLQDAQTKALRFGHTEVDVEHLLLALLDRPDDLVPRLIDRLQIDVDALRSDVEAEVSRRPRTTGPGAAPGQVFLTQRLSRLLDAADATATKMKDDYVSVEHLLLAMLDEDPSAPARRILTSRGVTREAFLGALSDVRGAQPGQVYVTQRLSRLLDAAEQEAKRLKDEYVSVEHLLVALLDEGAQSTAGRLLRDQGVTRDRFLQALTEIRGNQRVTSAMPEVSYEALEKYGRDLVADARAAKLDPVIGRDAEIRRVIQILSRKS
ncbi:MAG: Clp protease N-terminal domain-containing protein, partial [Actinomycetota bacterium]